MKRLVTSSVSLTARQSHNTRTLHACGVVLVITALFAIAVVITAALSPAQFAQARPGILLAAKTRYPHITGTALDGCQLCHGAIRLNAYGLALAYADEDFATIEQMDSDQDGAPNLTEITLHTQPGDTGSKPWQLRLPILQSDATR